MVTKIIGSYLLEHSSVPWKTIMGEISRNNKKQAEKISSFVTALALWEVIHFQNAFEFDSNISFQGKGCYYLQ